MEVENHGAVIQTKEIFGGKHLFMTNTDLSIMTADYQFVNLIYKDGTSADLKGKFINADS